MLSLLKTGDRVGAVQRTDRGTVYLFGHGVLMDDQSPGTDITLHLTTDTEQARIQRCVKLDSGVLVYESECSIIESEAWIDERFRNYKIETIDVRKYRSQK